MSDSEHSTVTYTSVSEDDSDIGSPGVDGPPIMPEDPYAYIMAAYEVPPSPDYIPGPEVPPSLDYIHGPEGPHHQTTCLARGARPLHAATSPTAESPGYIPSRFLRVLPVVDPTDYPADRDDDDDDEEEEEEHPASADFVPLVHRMTARISIRDEPFISLPPREEIPITTPTSPTHIEIPESCLPLRKRVRFASPTSSREVEESSAAGAARQDKPTISREDLYGFVDMVDEPSNEICTTPLRGSIRGYDLATIVEEETTSMYGIMEDAQDDQSLLRGRVNLLYRDRPVHLVLSDYARSDVMSLRTTVVAQSALISELQSADHRRQRVILELLESNHQRQVQLTKALKLLKGLQTQMVEFQRQHGPAKGPAQPDAPGEAGSSS
ncbi:hypothetical protein Tco_0988793 [Tanacetum coccineum]|uniref:Uncharacterized protein n=1 Tax=Tanacetum coccineum TaxID=301880 RepID=A0ABQ5ESA7_9ASTR